MKFYDKAIEDYTRPIRKDSEYLILHIGRTDACAATGQKALAVEDLNVVFEKSGNAGLVKIAKSKLEKVKQ